MTKTELIDMYNDHLTEITDKLSTYVFSGEERDGLENEMNLVVDFIDRLNNLES